MLFKVDQIEEKNIEILNRTIMQLKIKKENENKRLNMES